VSLLGTRRLLTRPTEIAALALAAAWPVLAQYPGQITPAAKNAATLRAVAVLEWTGEEGHPKASRLVPVSVYDGQQLQDAGIYMARPAPLALGSQVEYQLKQDGKTIGLFDVDGASQTQGAWVGIGKWKPLPSAHPKTAAQVAKIDMDDADSDRPILHRKYHADDPPVAGKSKGSGSTGTAPAPDPDRPTLHRADSSTSSGDSGTTAASTAPAPDPDRPTLHRTTPADDTDRPRLKKQKTADVGYVESVATAPDPNRPRLIRGKPTDEGPSVLPTLMGLPPEMNQMVAVSDARNTPDHPWNFSWANPADEVRMKADLETIARAALGLTPPPAPPAPKSKRTATHRHAKAAPPPPPAAPTPLKEERFSVFELTYGGGATIVLSASSGGKDAPEKSVTLIAQPDLYGNVVVLLKHVTDTTHLDVTPQMKLIGAVDALADNRGELLFELRGAMQREFALYRVLRGSADRIFTTSETYYGTMAAK